MAALVPRRSLTVTMIMGSPAEVCADADVEAEGEAFFSLVLSMVWKNERKCLLGIDTESWLLQRVKQLQEGVI